MTLKLTDELNPPVVVSVIVSFTELPCVTVTLAGEAEIEKLCTVRVTALVSVIPALVALIVSEYVPPGVDVPLVVIVSVLLPLPVMEVGLNVPPAPVGNPPILSEVVPLTPAVVTVAVPLDPATTVSAVVETDTNR